MIPSWCKRARKLIWGHGRSLQGACVGRLHRWDGNGKLRDLTRIRRLNGRIVRWDWVGRSTDLDRVLWLYPTVDWILPRRIGHVILWPFGLDHGRVARLLPSAIDGLGLVRGDGRWVHRHIRRLKGHGWRDLAIDHGRRAKVTETSVSRGQRWWRRSVFPRLFTPLHLHVDLRDGVRGLALDIRDRIRSHRVSHNVCRNSNIRRRGRRLHWRGRLLRLR